VNRAASAVGEGLAPAREARAIRPGERIHIVGAAGAGASAAALLAHAAGAAVTGCDIGGPSTYTEVLEARGIALLHAHDASHVRPGGGPPVDRLGVTKALTAVQPDHPELVAAREAGVPVEPWQQVVADAAASHGGRLVAVAGTHGKSTSAGWLVHVLVSAGADPAAFVGALLPATLTGDLPATARWGQGGTFVVEADEYAGNFDPYRPDVAVVLNAEWDHPDVFADRAAVVGTLEAWLRAPGAARRRLVVHTGDRGGRELADRMADWGARLVLVAPAEDSAPGDTDEPPSIPQRVLVRYAVKGGHLRIGGLPGAGAGELDATLRLGGAHNAGNAACVATAAVLLGVDRSTVAEALASYGGVARRMDVRGEPRGILVVDDYAHHPTAIRATIRALREQHPSRRLWAVHEPLTYHRAAAMLDELAAALAEADRVVVADIWPGRDPDTTITSAAELATATAALLGAPVAAPGSAEATAEHLAGLVREGDIVLVMGGGRAYVIAERLVALLESSPPE
jgi:UDP-N-acetylmuramate--alanine ligase